MIPCICPYRRSCHIISIALLAFLFCSCTFQGSRKVERSEQSPAVTAALEQLTQAVIQFQATSPLENPGKYAERYKTLQIAFDQYRAVTGQDSVVLKTETQLGNMTLVLPRQIIFVDHLPDKKSQSDTTVVFSGEEVPLKLQGEILDLVWLPGNAAFPDHILALFADSILSLAWPPAEHSASIVYRFARDGALPIPTVSPAGVLSIAADTTAKIIALTSRLKSSIALAHTESQILQVEAPLVDDYALPSAWEVIASRDLFYAPALKNSFRSLRRIANGPRIVLLDDAGYLNLFLENQTQPVWQSQRPWGNRIFALADSLIAVCDSRQSAFVVFRVNDRDLEFLGQSPFFNDNLSALTPTYGKREGFLVSTVARPTGPAMSRLLFSPDELCRGTCLCILICRAFATKMPA